MPADPVSALRAALRGDLVDAMRARRTSDISALRTAIAAIDNAEAVPAVGGPSPDSGLIAGASSGLGSSETQRRALSADDVHRILTEVIDELRAEADAYSGLGQTQAAADLSAQAAVLARYLTP